jgi:hypothetical protein
MKSPMNGGIAKIDVILGSLLFLVTILGLYYVKYLQQEDIIRSLSPELQRHYVKDDPQYSVILALEGCYGLALILSAIGVILRKLWGYVLATFLTGCVAALVLLGLIATVFDGGQRDVGPRGLILFFVLGSVLFPPLLVRCRIEQRRHRNS